MFNSQRPRPEDLPSSAQLIKATIGAAAIAGAILVTIVLPSEYAIDPTGIGRTLGLTEMGEIKVQLAAEAAQDAAKDIAAREAQDSAAIATAAAGGAAPAEAGQAQSTQSQSEPANIPGRNDTTRVTLAPGEGAEIKVTAVKGARIAFDWKIEGGVVNYDTHADAPGIAYHGYGKGKGSAGEQGVLVAAFDGKHGWFWRNRSDTPVTVVLKTQGLYSEVKRLV
jgi:hypothetical protein